MATNPKYKELLLWMRDHYITFRNLAPHLGVSAATARNWCYQERISPRSHAKLVRLGFPVELLPRAESVLRGASQGPRRAPIFPGLVGKSAAL